MDFGDQLALFLWNACKEIDPAVNVIETEDHGLVVTLDRLTVGLLAGQDDTEVIWLWIVVDKDSVVGDDFFVNHVSNHSWETEEW